MASCLVQNQTQRRNTYRTKNLKDRITELLNHLNSQAQKICYAKARAQTERIWNTNRKNGMN